VCGVGQKLAGVSPVSPLLFGPGAADDQPLGLLLDQRTGIGLGLAVERDERDREGDAGQEKHVAPADARPEPVEGVNDLVAHGDRGRVVAAAQRFAP
jgi:hypothetical protein